MDTKQKYGTLKYVFKAIFMVTFLAVLFYGTVSFITLDLKWPLAVSNAIRGVIGILYIIMTYMSFPDIDDYKSINQRR